MLMTCHSFCTWFKKQVEAKLTDQELDEVSDAFTVRGKKANQLYFIL